MIKSLEIKNFKSVKHLKIDCKRVNVFIGEPNTGKSNILEALGLFSLLYGELPDFIRMENMTDLFFDHEVESKVAVKAGDASCTIEFKGNYFIVVWKLGGRRIITRYYDYQGKEKEGHSIPDNITNMIRYGTKLRRIKFYRFKSLRSFENEFNITFLKPPHGENLFFVLYVGKKLRKLVGEIVKEFGFKLVFELPGAKIKLQKEIDDVIILHPYFLLSDTLQRIIFYTVAIETNQNSTLIFEEPESNAFPFYTKELAEKIADDRSNQYFMSTHNPYFLIPLISKAPKNEIGVFITYFEDYQTKVKSLNQKEIEEVLALETDIFFNLDRFLERG